MPNYRRADVQGGTYFFTVVTLRRQPFLCDEPVRTALRHGIAHTRKTHPFRIDGWVSLPNGRLAPVCAAEHGRQGGWVAEMVNGNFGEP